MLQKQREGLWALKSEKDSLLVGQGKISNWSEVKPREVSHWREKEPGILDLGKPPQSPGCLFANHNLVRKLASKKCWVWGKFWHQRKRNELRRVQARRWNLSGKTGWWMRACSFITMHWRTSWAVPSFWELPARAPVWTCLMGIVYIENSLF